MEQNEKPGTMAGAFRWNLDNSILAPHRAGRKRAMRPEHNFTKLANEWPLPGLSEIDRKLIESELFMADAVFHAEDADMDRSIYGYLKPMAQAFTRIAEVLFDANLLTVQLLENELRLFVVEVAIAGRWFQAPVQPADKERVEIFPGYLGHAAIWEQVNGSHRAMFMRNVFSVGIAEWTGKLLAREADTMRESPAKLEPESQDQRTGETDEVKRRRALLDAYKAATHVQSNKKIYEASNSGVHKPQFYQWLKGGLPTESSTAKNFERFLREKQHPIKRKRPH